MNIEILTYLQTSKENVILIYILYLCGILYLWGITMPIFPVIGVILAYLNKEGSSSFLFTHYNFSIRTFWFSILALIIIKILPISSLIIYILFVIWYICRNIIGFKYLLNDKPHPNSLTFWVI